MARLPWQNGRSRTKSGSEKNGFSGPHDWFSRTTSEPSRQALTELVKQHKREQSDGSSGMSPLSRSRSNTTTSQDRVTPSHSRSSSSDIRNEFWSTTNAHDDTSSTTDRTEGTAKTLLSKGSYMLRRRGSKLSLSSNGSSSTLGFTSPSRSQSINTSTTTRRSSRDDLRNKISAPFDFQHVTHTEQTQFAGLGRIEEAELAHRFSAVADEQRTAGELRGIETSEIHTSGGRPHSSTGRVMTATDTEVRLPSTPPRPVPPPKDGPEEQIIASEVYLPSVLYSTLNLSPISVSFPQQFSSSTSATVDERKTPRKVIECLPASNEAASLEAKPLVSKPLPQLPVIHAVTTEDDSARAMIAVPLPTPPCTVSPGSEIDPFTNLMTHHRQKSSVALPRHYTLYPSTKSSMPNLLSTDRALASFNTLSRHHSDIALSRQAREPHIPLSTRTSMSFAAIDIMDWEAAVDEAWDADDDDQEFLQSGYHNKLKRTSPPIGSLVAEQSTSTGSTPLMMAQSQRPSNSVPERISPLIGSDFHRLEIVQEDECSMPLSGLGICSFSSANTADGSVRDSTVSEAQLHRSQSSASSSRQHCLTRSSSQESVIYSLASSIIETQRSSKSSVYTHDTSGRKAEDLDMVEEASSEELESYEAKNRIRPESGCLPSNIFDLYQQSYGSARQMAETPLGGNSPDHKDHKPLTKIAVPERRSSISNTAQTSRSRSNTVGSRHRQNSRVSYSLFPAAQPLQSTAISS